MGKLGCKCGNTIYDQQDFLPYKAHIVPNQNLYDFYEKLQEPILDFVEAKINNKKEEWLNKNFNPSYPRNLSDESMIIDFTSRLHHSLMKDIYQCEKCGRIYIESTQNNFISFAPEDDSWKNILAKPNNL